MKITLTFLFLFTCLCFVTAHTPEDRPLLQERIEVSVYPNPSTDGNFSIKLTGLERSDAVVVKVYNLIGSEVYSHSFSSVAGEYKQLVSLSSAPKGIYMVEVSMGEEKYTYRLSLL